MGDPVPMPMTTHHHYRDHAAEIRTLLEGGAPATDVLVWMDPEGEEAGWTDAPPMYAPAPRRTILELRKVAAPAPWTGAPYLYVWTVAMDHLGRWVAGDARREPVGVNLSEVAW